jgi:hypothetical protein
VLFCSHQENESGMPRKTRQAGRSRGRSGGRAGASGYDFQDIYVALQLGKLLMGDRDPIHEVLWEKKALDLESGSGAEPIYVDDAIIRTRSGRCVYVQLKEHSPAGGWSAASFVRSGAVSQFWKQWLSKPDAERGKTVLRFASGADVSSLAIVVDDARRSRTPAELLSDEASEDTVKDVQTLAGALSVQADSPMLLDFLRSLHFEQLSSAEEIQGQIIRSLTPFGEYASELATRLIRLVAMSKHVGQVAGSSFTRSTLLRALENDGVPLEHFMAAGLVTRAKNQDPLFWDAYRQEVVNRFRTFRVYGLQVERAVIADLPSLFVPLKLAAIPDRRVAGNRNSIPRQDRRSLLESVLGDDRDSESESAEHSQASDLGSVLAEKRRFALIGGPGSGKTTTLRWLALVSALGGEEGRELRTRFKLPEEPLLPVFVRFRGLAERIRARGLEGVSGRVGLVSEFLAAEFETGIAGRVPSRTESLEMAEELLGSSRCIFLFDALDEVSDEATRTRLFDAVADLIDRYPEPRVVVSSRPYAFRNEVAPLELALFEPLPLGRSGQRAFARQWYRAVRSHLGTALTERDADIQAADLAKAAVAVPDLAENPLLLSILALVHFNRQGLPLERSVLYDNATLAMLGHWERDAAGRNLGDDVIPADWARKLKLQESSIRRVVESLARDVQLDGAGADFGHEVAIESLSRGIQAMAGLERHAAREAGELLLQLLVERSGLVQERSPGLFAFVHISFQDYLTARWFVGAGEKTLREVASLAGDERHGEVLRFAVAILSSGHRAEADDCALRLILDAAEKDAILAAACLLEAPRLQLEESAAEDLGRRVWKECTLFWRRHVHPRVASRLIWTLLARSSHSDDLLMEFLALEPEGERRHPKMGPEGIVFLLTSRPVGPLSDRLRWVLRQVCPFGKRAAGDWRTNRLPLKIQSQKSF